MTTVYFEQLLAGRDFAVRDATAGQMANFAYVIGDAQKRQVMLVDPAWDIDGLLDRLDAKGLELVGVLATHYHPDHVGGEMFGIRVEGLQRLIETRPVPVHIHRNEAQGMQIVTQLSATDFQAHASGDVVLAGDVPITLLHTPGHTPGSQCFFADGKLLAGDTLFVQGCGRVDLPGGDSDEMYRTLTQRLATLGDDVLLYPGHDYGDRPSSSLGDARRTNTYLRIRSLEDWRRLMGTAAY